MAGDGPEAEAAKEKSSRGLWRDRLKEKASKIKGKGQNAQQDKDVADFLRSGSSTSVNSDGRINPTPPRIDTGTLRFGSSVVADDRLGALTSEPLGFPTQGVLKKKHPKPPGIHVAFTKEAPAIIGEGGDEAELPVNQVIGSWMPVSAPPHPHVIAPDSSFEPPPPILQAGTDAGRRGSLQRAPTGLKPPEGSWAQKRLSMSLEEGLVQAQKEELANDLALREPTLPNISLQPETPAVQMVEERSYAAMPSEGPSYTSPPNGLQSDGAGFLAYNPSLRGVVESARPPSRERPPSRDKPATRDATAHALAMGTIKASTDPSLQVYPSGATVPQSSHDNLLHQPKIKSEHSPFPSPVFDQYGEMPNIHDVTNATPEAGAADDFYARMRHMQGIFRLTAERPRSVGANSLSQWLRASVWWFLRGKTDLDNALRMTGLSAGRGDDNLPSNKQCYVNMAKAEWILHEIVPGIVQGHSVAGTIADTADGLDHEQLLEVLQRMKWEMGRYFLKLDGRGLLPPPELLVQGADPEIWIKYPSLPSGLYALTAGLNPRTLVRPIPATPEIAFSMPLNDSESAYSYGRFFGLAYILGDSAVAKETAMPCAVSIIRDRGQMLAEFLVTTQDGQINLHIQSDKRIGPSWTAVKWNAKGNSMLVVLMGEIAVEVQLREADFRVLYGVHDYNHKLESERMPRAEEELLFGDVVKAFHFMGPKEIKTGFPATPVRDCKVRLFQTSSTITEGAGSRKVFRGYRLSVASPPTDKTLSNVSRELKEYRPILFNNLRGEGGAPALALIIHESDKPSSLIFSFETSMKRSAFHTILAATATSPDECFSEDIPMHSFAVAETAGSGNALSVPFPMPASIQWQRLKVINLGSNLDEAPCTFSDRLRVCMSCSFGSITDRMNLGAGELRMGLDPADATALRLWRPAQNSLTFTFVETAVRSKDIVALSDILAATADRPTVRIYKFLSLPVLHDFQALATGFAVAYDGAATHFSITRRRMFVSIHKHLETDHARLQILQEGNRTLLVAFFRNFTTGKSMGFQLRGTDVYEGSQQGSKFLVRFVEAKFSMPKAASEDGADLVCLDVIENPTEHDDLVFGFDSEDERDLFARALPASMTKASRMATFRR